MLRKNKRGLEVSINFIVTIIIAIIVLVTGIAFAARFFGKAENIKAQVDQKTQGELENLIIGQGQKVAAYPTELTINRATYSSFGIGINNVIGSDATFTINIAVTNFVNASQQQESLSTPLSQLITLTYLPTDAIRNNKDDILPVAVQVAGAAPSGTYVLDAKVAYTDTSGNTGTYGDQVYKIYVTVP